ncbi:bifunctional diguanylate cyclase/phosphodiesterase [Nostoc sp. DedVER01b]|uniref:bifunctional diguanylate cyclase/phosphodiesterase n=1 Tax=Nostoc sp. DedVER01b TaxID=3075404 RepID=UPI002AD47346|nr:MULTISPECIES: EAL domain-containing protein [unclassified Nostoc]MDZ7988625.1 EAL domain-containing protein [Nostoc sp. DedVER02]MDZ8113655.1 EAL domain-containing protein [Nostoc sp. DedVER01b]
MSQICPISKTCACRNIARCQTKEAGRLFLWFPVPHTLKKVTSYLQQFNLKYELMHERPGLSLDCRPGQSQEIARNLSQILAPRELKETQVLFIRGAVQPQLHDFSDIASLQRFIKLNQSNWLVEMLATERFTSYFQAIVSIKDTSQIYGYESLLRGLDEQGNLVLPGSILELATETGLIPQLDQIARLSTITQISRHQVSGHIFINFAPMSLYDPAFCLRSTVEAIDQAGISHERIVFEVVESDNPQDLAHLKAVLQYYRDAGFLIALDDLGSGYSSLNLLHQLRPDFIKLDIELIRDVHQDLYKASITEKLLEITQKLNIQTVAEGIECIEELNWLRERGATLAQGYLIAKPSAVPVTTTPHFEAIALNVALADCKLVKQHVQHQNESERIVAAVTQRIRQSLQLDEILQTTVDEVRQLFEVDRVVIYQFEPDWSGLVAVESLAEECMSILGFHVMDTCFQPTRAVYFQQGNTKAIEDVENAGLSPCHLDLLRSLQIRANLVVPILQKERLWGLLIAHQCRHARQWQQSEINLFNQLAGQTAIAIQQSELYHQLQQANHELQRLACSDGLTQVGNRRCFDDTFNAQWQRLAREQGSLSLILCDVDYFKLYNDTHGHLAGDDALRQVAKAISQTVKRPADLVARYGGEEFAVILPNTDMEGAIAVARNIQTNISALKMLHPHSQVSEFITLSLGVATITPHSQLSPATLIAAADQGLYQAKAQGRNCVVQIDCQDVNSKAVF